MMQILHQFHIIKRNLENHMGGRQSSNKNAEGI